MAARGQGLRSCSVGMAVLCLAATSVTRAVAAEAPLTAWQEITVLTISKLEAAAVNCGFKLEGGRVSVLLDTADLSLDAVHTRPRSDALQAQIDAIGRAYQNDRDAACSRAWDIFGPDGSTHGYLVR